MDGTSNLTETLQAIDSYIKTQHLAITRGEQLKVLMKNPIFNELIVEGYFETEARKLFDILTDPTGASQYSDAEINLKLAGISTFKGYVGTPEHKGTIEIEASNAILNIEREEAERVRVTAEYAKDGEV